MLVVGMICIVLTIIDQVDPFSFGCNDLNTFGFVQSLILIVTALLTLIAFNVKLFKMQFFEFETSYKVYNAFVVIICEITYVIKTQQCTMLGIDNFLDGIVLLLTVIGVS